MTTPANPFRLLMLACYKDSKLATRFRNDLLGILTLGYGHALTLPQPVYLEQHLDILSKKIAESSAVLIFYSTEVGHLFWEQTGLREELEAKVAPKNLYWVEARPSDTSNSGISFMVPELGALASLKSVARDKMVLAIAEQLAHDIDGTLVARGLPLPSAQRPPIISLELPLDGQTCTYCGCQQGGVPCSHCGNAPKQSGEKTVLIIGSDTTEEKDRVTSLSMHFHAYARARAVGVSGFMHHSKLEPLCHSADLILLLISPDFLGEALEGSEYQGVRAARTLLLENPDLQRKCVLAYLRPCLASHFLPNTGWEFTTVAAERANLDSYGVQLSQALQRL